MAAIPIPAAPRPSAVAERVAALEAVAEERADRCYALATENARMKGAIDFAVSEIAHLLREAGPRLGVIDRLAIASVSGSLHRAASGLPICEPKPAPAAPTAAVVPFPVRGARAAGLAADLRAELRAGDPAIIGAAVFLVLVNLAGAAAYLSGWHLS